MQAEQPIIQGDFIIQKMTGKGAWSYVVLPLLPRASDLPFGWNIVKGYIDDFEINQYKLWPMANLQLFLPIKAAIRKKIKKEAGDYVYVTLYIDDSELVIPEEFYLCLLDHPTSMANFDQLTSTSKKQYIDYVMDAKTFETRARRMTNTIVKLEKGLKYHESDREE